MARGGERGGVKMGVNTEAKGAAKRRDKACFTSQGQHGKVIRGKRVSRVLESDLHHGNMSLFFTLTHPPHSPLF